MDASQNRLEKKTRYSYIDLLNILASFSVVVLHCTGEIFDYSKEPSWLVALVLQSICHFAVPVFFMITGITLLEYRAKYDTKSFYKKRFLKTGIPFLFWSCFYIVFRHYDVAIPITDFVDAILNNGALNIFWFFYTLFGLYFMMPIFSLLAKPENKKTITLFVGMFFFFSAIFPLLKLFLPLTSSWIPPLTTTAVGYLFCGFLLKYETYQKRTRIGIYGIGVLAVLLMVFGTYFLSAKKGETDLLFMDYYSIATIPSSFALVLFAKHISYEKLYRIFPKKIMQALSSAAFGVYLTHMILLTLNEWHKPFPNLSAISKMFLYPLAIYSICVLFVLLLKKIPILKKLVP